MRKLKRRNIKKTIIVITALLLILFGALLFAEDKKKTPEEEKSNPLGEETEEPADHKPNETDQEEVSEEPEEEPEPEQPSVEIPYSTIIENPGELDVLVNKQRNLPSTYIPEDLVTLNDVPTVLENPEVNQLRSAAYEALKELFKAAKEEAGYELFARSGYRSYNTQTSLYSSYVDNYGQEAADKYSAKPGQSEHQTGLAIDITCEALNYRLDDTFADTDEGKWVSENAHRFGYIIRYPKGKEDITGYLYEPWHIRYLGTELAEEVFESGLTLEEFFQQQL